MKKDPRTSLFKSFSLFCIALVLLVTTAPLGFLYALVRQIVFEKAKTIQPMALEARLIIRTGLLPILSESIPRIGALKKEKRAKTAKREVTTIPETWNDST